MGGFSPSWLTKEENFDQKIPTFFDQALHDNSESESSLMYRTLTILRVT